MTPGATTKEARAQTSGFTKALLAWHQGVGRDFPWRREQIEPLHLLVAEMLLRKTRGESVLPVWETLIQKYPDAESLAEADELELVSILKPLGLQHVRAAALKKVARALLKDHGGKVPNDPHYLVGLPHVGRYIANAVLTMSGAAQLPAVDQNVVRVLHRAFGMRIPAEVHKAHDLWQFAADLTPKGKAKHVNLGLIDLGALICTPRAPKCVACPCQRHCDFGRQAVKPGS